MGWNIFPHYLHNIQFQGLVVVVVVCGCVYVRISDSVSCSEQS